MTLFNLYVIRDFNWPAANAELQRAVAIDPTNTQVVLAVATTASVVGNYDDAERQIRAAMQRDPLESILEDHLAGPFTMSDRQSNVSRTYRSLCDAPDLRHFFVTG